MLQETVKYYFFHPFLLFSGPVSLLPDDEASNGKQGSRKSGETIKQFGPDATKVPEVQRNQRTF